MQLENRLSKNAKKKAKMALPLTALGVAGGLYALFINRRKKTAENSHTRILKDMEQKNDQISLLWNHSPGQYRVYRDSTLIYTGPGTKITDYNLTPGTMYTYSIEKIDGNGRVLEITKVETSTSVTQKEKENPLRDLIFTTVVTNGKIGLEWDAIEGISQYTVFRNGQPLETVNGSSFTDQLIHENEEYTYTIKAKRPLQRSDQLESEANSLIANAVGMLKKDSEASRAANEEFTMTKKLPAPAQILTAAENQQKQTSKMLWQLQYTTFLKDKWVKNPNPVDEKHFFRGDDREFHPDSSSFRTRADLFIDLDLDDSPVLLTREVGETQAFNANHEFLDKKRASTEGIQLEKVHSDQDRIKFELKHAVSNPMVASPAIDYVVCGTFHKSGQIDLVGYHDQAPHHEIYLKENGTDTWTPIHQSESKGLEMMATQLANHYWRYSTYSN